MRVLLLCNNWVGWQVAHWLREQGEEIVGLVLHPATRRKWGAEIIQSAALEPTRVFDAPRLREQKTLLAIESLEAEVALSAFFGYILKPDFLRLFPDGCINIHPALLPYNRGAHPNVWSIVEGTPAGTTLHYVDPGVDTGDIIAQREVSVSPTDTGESLYRKLERASVELFCETWPALRAREVPRSPQRGSTATSHRAADVARIDKIDLDARYKASDFINLLRARTFRPYPGAYFVQDGRRVFLRLELLNEEDLE